MSESPNTCAVVVGAGSRSGIGGALCACFAAEGLHVYAVGRSAGKQDPLIAEIVSAGGKATAIEADASQPAAVKGLLMSKGEDGALHPDAIAETYWQLHRQHRSAWTHELDLRPYKESF